MTHVRELIELSKISETITIEATVDTGFECLAEEECLNKFGSKIPICRDRGRIYFNIPIHQYPIVKTMRSVNNLNLVVDYFPNVGLVTEDESTEANTHNLNVIGQLNGQISWKKYLEFWKATSNFEGILYPSREEYVQAVNALSNNSIATDDFEHTTSDQNVETFIDGDTNIGNRSSSNNTDILHYRVTCYRSGKHTFGSQDAARSFGGKIQDMFNWIVNLSKFHLEIILQLRDNISIVLLCLTESSMHRRNIAHYGLTTLRSTVAFNMLQLVKPNVGDLIIDPMCGCGALPIEGAIAFDGTYHLCGDINENSVSLTDRNKSECSESFEKNLLVDAVNWDVNCLPLRNSSIDIVATDMPFGKRIGSKLNNRTLYVAALKEFARVVKPGVGRMVLITLDRTSYNMALRVTKKYWRQMRMMVVKMGGLKVCTYTLRRTNWEFR